jgi:hypothetical protein
MDEQKYGIDFLLTIVGDGTFKVDYTQVISDSRVVMQAVLSKLMGVMWWIPQSVNLLSYHGELFDDAKIAEEQARIIEVIESEQQTQNANAHIEVDSAGTIAISVSFFVGSDPFAYDIIVGGQSLDVFVSGANIA